MVSLSHSIAYYLVVSLYNLVPLLNTTRTGEYRRTCFCRYSLEPKWRLLHIILTFYTAICMMLEPKWPRIHMIQVSYSGQAAGTAVILRRRHGMIMISNLSSLTHTLHSAQPSKSASFIWNTASGAGGLFNKQSLS